MQKALTDNLPSTAEGIPPRARAPGEGNAMSAESDEKKKHFKTEGEKKFDTHAYRFWGYYMNVLLSLFAVYWVERTHSGQKFLKGWADGFEKLGAKRESAEFLSRKSFFLAGGFAVIPPIKWLENKKTELVKKYNREIYGVKADTDPQIKQSEQEVADAPKQTWKSVIVGRLLALVPFYITVGLLWDRTSWLARATNPEFKGMTRTAMRDLEKADPRKFEQMASKGFYIDKPITRVSRDLGKLFSGGSKAFEEAVKDEKFFGKCYRLVFKYVGKIFNFLPKSEEAFANIQRVEKQAPAGVVSFKQLDEAGKAVPLAQASHEPMHSVGPYYFISEAITSAMVAIGLFFITRVTGPFFGRTREEKRELREERREHRHQVAMQREAAQVVAPKRIGQPDTTINLASLEQQHVLQAAVEQGR